MRAIRALLLAALVAATMGISTGTVAAYDIHPITGAECLSLGDSTTVDVALPSVLNDNASSNWNWFIADLYWWDGSWHNAGWSDWLHEQNVGIYNDFWYTWPDNSLADASSVWTVPGSGHYYWVLVYVWLGDLQQWGQPYWAGASTGGPAFC